jgi:hypothetical protein
MTWAGQVIATRRAKPSHQEWVPLPYQRRAVDFLKTHRVAYLPLRPGGRKTSITLAAFQELKAEGQARTMLVIAPLRVCRQVWRQEAAKWTQFKDIKFSLLHGPKKDERLKDDADVWLINPEGVEWLCKKFFGRPLPFDIVPIDELTRFKNSQANRSKALRPRLKATPFRWGLSGSPSPNGHMDLFGQMLILDDGAALGRYITHYRDQYFQLGYDGFTYDLMPGAEKRIVERMAPYWFQMDDADYAQLPDLLDIPHEIELEPAQRKLYDRMKKDMIAALPEGIVTAANSAACYSKLSQMANGAVYVGDNKDKVSVVHEQKLDALEDLLEELNGEPLLVAYEFNHDLDRLRDRFGVVDPDTGRKVLPYLGKGTSAKQEADWIAAWNRGELPLLCAHPASAGHGLNMQGASAFNVCWFGITWDFELYDQFIRRIRRDGTLATQIFNHLLIVKNTIDELKLVALRSKDMTQSNLMRALNYEIRREAETQATGGTVVNMRNSDMVAKLSRPGAPAANNDTQAPQEQAGAPRPKGWGAPRPTEAAQEQGDGGGQRERIQETLTGDAGGNVTDARSAFGRKVQDQRAQISTGESRVGPGDDPADHGQAGKDADPAPKTRRSRASNSNADETSPAPSNHIALNTPDTSPAMLTAARAQLMAAVVASDPSATVEDLVDAADALWKWVAAA